MLKEQCLQIGSLIKSHGVHGELVLESHTPEMIENIKESVFLEIEGLLVPFFIEDVKPLSSQRFRVKFLWFSTEQKAKKLLGLPVFLLSSEVILSETDFVDSPNLLLDFKVMDVNMGEIGFVTDFIDNPANPLLVVMKGKKELLIPIHPHFIIGVHTKKKQITLKLPEGLVDLD